MPRVRSMLVGGVLVAFAVACSDSTAPGVGGADSPLRELAHSTTTDSTGRAIPQPQTSTTPGTFRGTVLAPSAPGAGNDSLNTAPRIAGAVLTAYPATNASTANPTLGAAVASVTTGANGQFVFPALDGGAYVVTITPPAGSAYGGMWVTATAHAGSAESPWWVVLPRS